MLAQQEYCGDIINFKTYSKSFRNKTQIDNPVENWAVFKDVHEPIIDRETLEMVQKLIAKTKRRAPKKENGEKNMFCGLLYCADCSSPLLLMSITQTSPSNTLTALITEPIEALARQRTIYAPIRLSK